jgi:galactokinase
VATGRAITGPGRVTLIGDHTDYNQGLSLPMAVGMGVTVRWTATGEDRITVTSTAFDEIVHLPLGLVPDPAVLSDLEPGWARLVGAMVALSRPETGGTLALTADLPVGAGLSSSAATAVALAEALGVTGPPEVVARLCQQAEHLAGAEVGIMDPLVCAGGRSGHAMLIDFATLDWEHVPIPADVEILVVDSGQRRSVGSSPYGLRVAECAAATALIGPLGLADPDDLAGLRDPLLRRRARHVVSETDRVRSFRDALISDDPAAAGATMVEGHRSLAHDFEVSTPVMDDLVTQVCALPGVFGARLTGAGFGGCVVVLAASGAVDPVSLAWPAWPVRAVDGTVAARR